MKFWEIKKFNFKIHILQVDESCLGSPNRSILKKLSPRNKEKTKKKVLFGAVKNISADEDNSDLNSTFTVEDDLCDKLPQSTSVITDVALTSFASDNENENFSVIGDNNSVISDSVTPKLPRKRNSYKPGPDFTPRRSLRILAKTELNSSLASGGYIDLFHYLIFCVKVVFSINVIK